MSYATPTELRDAYRVGIDGDALAHRDDADLEEALGKAAVDIDSWRPAGELTDADRVVLAAKSLPLARSYLYQDQVLDAEHPIRADAAAVRTWLKALAAGAVRLPSAQVGTATAAQPAAPRVSAPTEVFGPGFGAAHPGREPWQG